MGGTRRSLAAFVFIGYRLMIGFSEISSQSSSLPVCEIPEGKFDGMFYDSYFNESLYGDRCPAEVSFHMVRIYRCLFKYCCSSPCVCSTALLSNTCPNNATVIPCFEVKTEPEYFRYNCCSGSVEDRFHVCTKQIECKRRADSGCDVGQVCLRNETSGFDYCDCPPGFNITVVNSNGTKVCKDINECASNDSSSCSDVCVNSNGSYSCACDRNRTLDPDGHHCSDPPLPLTSIPDGFPYPYIIAIVLGLLLLLLLLLLLFLFCRRRRRRSVAYSNDAYEAGIFKVIAAEGKKKSDPGPPANDRSQNEYVDTPTKGGGGGGGKMPFNRQTSSSSTSSTHPLFAQSLSSQPLYSNPLSIQPVYSQHLASLQQSHHYEELDAHRRIRPTATQGNSSDPAASHHYPFGPTDPADPADPAGLDGSVVDKPTFASAVKDGASSAERGIPVESGHLDMKPAAVVHNQYTELPGAVATAAAAAAADQTEGYDHSLALGGYVYVDEGGGYAEIK